MNVLLEKSLMNCHANEIDSLVLKEGPNMIRMFIARRGHNLWRNDPTGPWAFTVGMHRHHCDVTLMPVVGDVYNVLLNSDTERGFERYMKSYRYTSDILKSGKPGFEPLDDVGIRLPLIKERLTAPRFMKATELHSIYVPQGREAAWYVWEGNENPNHNNITYSNDPKITEFDFLDFNQPMTEERLREDLEIIGVYNA